LDAQLTSGGRKLARELRGRLRETADVE
jgi:hypothetical protein